MKISNEQFQKFLEEIGNGMIRTAFGTQQRWKIFPIDRWYNLEFNYYTEKNLIEVLAIYPETDEFIRRVEHIASIEFEGEQVKLIPLNPDATSREDIQEILDLAHKHFAPKNLSMEKFV